MRSDPVRDELRPLAGRVREAVELAGTQIEVAKRLGISPTALKRYISGRAEPQAGVVASLASLAGVTIEWLLTGVGPKVLAESIAVSREQEAESYETATKERIRRRVAAACDAAGVEWLPDGPTEQALVADAAAIVSRFDPADQVKASQAISDALVLAIAFPRRRAMERLLRT